MRRKLHPHDARFHKRVSPSVKRRKNFLVIMTVQGNTAAGQPLAQYTYSSVMESDQSCSVEQEYERHLERATWGWEHLYPKGKADRFSVVFYAVKEER